MGNAIHGGWSYGAYSACMADASTCWDTSNGCAVAACNTAGTKRRYNQCNNPSPSAAKTDSYGFYVSPGNLCWSNSQNTRVLDEVEITSCTGFCDPVDGGYTEWSDWGACSASCGGGTQSHTRQCTQPSPDQGGQNCTEQGLGSASGTQACNDHSCIPPNGISMTCNDDNTITVKINYEKDSSILSATYGSCNETDMRGADVSDATAWNVTMDPASCGMEGKLRNLIYNQTAEFTVGRKDGNTIIKFATFEVDSYCNYTDEYTVTFGYGPVSADSYDFTDSGGLLGLNFYITSYSNSSYNAEAAPSTSAGDPIYLKLALNGTLNDDFDHAANMDASTGKVFVPTKCAVSDENSNTYTLFDTNGSAKCKNDIINLSVTYNSGDPQSWYIQHLIFLLNSERMSDYTLQCNVLVCDAEEITTCKDAYTCLTN